MKTGMWILIGVVVVAMIVTIYMYTRGSSSELFSGSFGLGSGLSVAGMGPVYEDDSKSKEGFCGSCS